MAYFGDCLTGKKRLLFPATFVKQARRLTQQRQHCLWNLVCLRQYRSTSLLQDLRARHVGNFGSVVSVLDTGLSSRQVVDRVVQVVDGRFETVLNRTHVRTRGIDFRDCSVSSRDNSLCRGVIGDCSAQASAQGTRGGVDQRVAVDGDGVVRRSTCTNLNFQRGRYGTVQQFLTVEVSCARDTVDFSQTLFDFSVDRSQVRRTVSVGSSLNRQLTNTL